MTGRATAIRARLGGRAVIRDSDEERVSSHLELFFDLTFVVGISRAAAALHHQLVSGHTGAGVVGFVGGFVAVWWAWMNFTWFASAHDSDDVPYRLLTLVQMAGVLVLAAGLTRAIEDRDFAVATIGYSIMRGGLICNWLRVARDQPETRARALRYATGEFVLQVLWLLRLAAPDAFTIASFVLLGIGELLVPVWAEQAAGRPMFNAGHIEERYGLFTIILLGESILAATVGFEVAVNEAGLTVGLAAVGLGGLVLAFAVWWIYFDHPGHLSPTPHNAFRWGYGHVVVFMSLAAMGAGIHVATDSVVGHADARVGALAVALPSAAYLLGLALIMTITGTPLVSSRVLPKLVGAAVLVLIGLTAPVAATVAGCAVVMFGLAVAMVVAGPGAQPVNVEASDKT
jgi:low temperature requirement protein LtrA